jgi:zinc/manganese transport system substrate-binding protein
MYKKLLTLVAVFFAVSVPVQAQKKLDIVTTLPDLQYIASFVGGDRVEAFAIATGFQDPHFVDPKPSYIVKLSRADMFVTIGLDLEQGWVPPLLNSARNDKILKGAPGYVDASVNMPLLEVPSSTSREQGDIHIYGNPHYWLDPSRGRRIAQNIYEAFARLQPQNEAYFAENLQRFNQQLDEKMADWEARMQPYRGTKVIAYHDQWPYFEEAFGLEIVDYLEPKPGLPPTPSQLAKVIGLMEQHDIKVIIIAPYNKPDAAELVARKVDGTVVTLASSVDAFPEVKTYFDLFDYDLDQIIGALK